jgi:hypothetical protein
MKIFFFPKKGSLAKWIKEERTERFISSKIQPFFEAERGERCKDLRKENPANGVKQFNFNRDRFSAFG